MIYNLSSEEKKIILEMHNVHKKKIVNEQGGITNQIKSELDIIRNTGCIPNQTKVVRFSTFSEPVYEYAIKQESIQKDPKTGTPKPPRYLFLNDKIGFLVDGKLKIENIGWKEALDKCVKDKNKSPQEITTDDFYTNLNDKQREIIKSYSDNGWFLATEITDSQRKTWYNKVISPASDKIFKKDLIMWYPPYGVERKKIKQTQQSPGTTDTKPTDVDSESSTPMTFKQQIDSIEKLIKKAQLDKNECKLAIKLFHMDFKAKGSYKIPPENFDGFKEKVQACVHQYKFNGINEFITRNRIKELQGRVATGTIDTDKHRIKD